MTSEASTVEEGVSPLTGGCFCGEVRYQFQGKPAGFLCFCRDCQYFASGMGQATIFAQDSALEIDLALLKAVSATAASGASVTRYFCPECCTQLFVKTSTYPSHTAIIAGSLDDNAAFLPRAVNWQEAMPRWQAECVRAPAS